jgi:hypothetical protein
MTARAAALPLLVLMLASCGSPNGPLLSKEPISVRGWIADVEGSTRHEVAQVEAYRRMQLFQQTYVSVENAPYVSGGINENGSFMLLDVPPGTVTITFQAPGAPAARLVMQNVPGNADVLVPAVLLRPTSVSLLQPEGVLVRVVGEERKPTGAFATIAGMRVAVMQVPRAELSDRHDPPNPPGTSTIMPVVK